METLVRTMNNIADPALRSAAQHFAATHKGESALVSRVSIGQFGACYWEHHRDRSNASSDVDNDLRILAALLGPGTHVVCGATIRVAARTWYVPAGSAGQTAPIDGLRVGIDWKRSELPDTAWIERGALGYPETIHRVASGALS